MNIQLMVIHQMLIFQKIVMYLQKDIEEVDMLKYGN